jgi:hypothetical protein
VGACPLRRNLINSSGKDKMTHLNWVYRTIYPFYNLHSEGNLQVYDVHSKNWMKKSQNVPVWLSISAHICSALWKAQKYKSVINWIWLLLSVSDWHTHCSTRWFALLRSPRTFFAVPVSVLWGGVGKKRFKTINLDVKNIFAGSYTEHCWRCSKS